MVTCHIDMYVYVRKYMRDRKRNFDKKTKATPGAGRGREHGRTPPPFESGEASKVRHDDSTSPNGGPHLELGRLRLKTLSTSDFSIAETTWPMYLHIYL